MKTNILLIALTVLIFTACKKDDENSDSATVEMGNQYVYDVYYSFNSGVIKKVDKTVWDIAFSVPLQSATILINESAGVELFCVGDTNDWNSVDTSKINMLSPRYNNKSDWSKGAFNQYSLAPYNFGWGTYNMGVHNVYGDSIYVIMLTNGSCKKLAIKERIGSSDTYVIRMADPNGANEEILSFSPKTFSNKNFIHYSLVTGNMMVVEPDKNTWDLLFTTYIAKVPAGTTYTNYYVMGILASQDVEVAKVTGIDPAAAVLSDTTAGFNSQADLIGWDWKTYDQTAGEYSMVPNTCYFVRQSGGSIYKIYFTGFKGSSTGEVFFKTQLMQ
jgi:hypothetical protein